MRKTELYFFSGTGNTLLLAKELEKRIPEIVLHPIAAYRTEETVTSSADSVGFCFPNHGGQLPAAMKSCIERMKIPADAYVFALVSSGGTDCGAFDTIEQLLHKTDCILSGRFLVQFPSFNPKTDDKAALPNDKDISSFLHNLPGKMETIAAAVVNSHRASCIDEPKYRLPPFIQTVVAPLVLRIVEKHKSFLDDYFYTDSTCTGCGLCETVCQTERIHMHEQKPVWKPKHDCYCCHACMAFCPCGSIQVRNKLRWAGSKTTENPRFKPPFATAGEIARQRTEKNYAVDTD